MQENSPAVPIPAVPSIFKFQGKEVRVVEIDGEPWCVASDVCSVLGIVWKGTSATLPSIPDTWRRVSKVQTLHGNQHGTVGERMQEVVIINEAASYKLAFRSNKPEADTFTNFIASEVIPAIRKHGHYSVAPQEQLPAPRDPFYTLQLHYDVLAKHDSDINALAIRANQVADMALATSTKLEDYLDTRPLLPHQCHSIQKAVAEKVTALSTKHGLNYRPVVFSSVYGFIKRTYNVNTYSAIASARFDEALSVIKNLTIEQLPENVSSKAKGVTACF